MRYWEDFHVGDVTELGPVTVTEDEIVEFARRFDPQPFHVDPEAARESPFGGLIASGWHTAAIYMGMFVREILDGSASLGSPGVEELRWLAPVRPGDTLHGRATITDVAPSSTNAHRGTIFGTHELRNQDGVVVMRFRARGFIARRAT
ncbi:MAG: MaoC family dehydratase [Microvirga sp.]